MLFRQIVFQKPARDFAVEQRRFRVRFQSNLPGQSRIAGENKSRPTLTAFAKDSSKQLIEASQILFLADALAIGGIANQDAWLVDGRLKIAQLFSLEAQQVANARRLCAAFGKRDGIATIVAAKNGRRQSFAHLPAPSVAHFSP